MSKRSKSRKRVAQMVALCAILGLLFAVAAPAMIFLGASQQAAQHNTDTSEGEVITEEVLNELLESLETEPLEESSEEALEETPSEETETTE